MKSDYSFLEVNPGPPDEDRTEILSVCYFNAFSPFSENVLQKTVQYLTDEGVPFQMTLVDLTGELDESDHLEHYLKLIPGLKIVLSDKRYLFFGLNLFVRECKSAYILMLSSDLILSEFKLENIASSFKGSNDVSFWVPQVYSGEDILETVSGISIENLRPYVSIKKFEPGAITFCPWRMSWFFEREKFFEFTSFEDFYTDTEVSVFDMAWKLWKAGETIGCASGFVCYRDGDQESSLQESLLLEGKPQVLPKQKRFEEKLFLASNIDLPDIVRDLRRYETKLLLLLKWKKRNFLKRRRIKRLDRFTTGNIPDVELLKKLN